MDQLQVRDGQLLRVTQIANTVENEELIHQLSKMFVIGSKEALPA